MSSRIVSTLAAATTVWLAALASGSCNGKSPVTPGPTPQPVNNAPPVIQTVSVAAGSGRLEPDTDVEVTAQVQDAESTPASLTYVWSATVGTFTGSGPAVKWRLASGVVSAPTAVVVRLEVVERYQSYDAAGNAITKENRVSKDAAAFIVHDSVAEISKITVRFLVDLFGNSNVPAEACVVDFWDDCRGKSDELGDIQVNRQLFQVLSAQATVQSVTFRNANTADVVAACRWQDRVIANGSQGVSEGPCLLTAVYHNDRWWLCSSSVDHDLFRRWCLDGTSSCIPPAPTTFSIRRYV
ncbi:MAG: hypothetical protein IT184_00855 [Acidobacteria bacterium]|nr:hypothetical protein [Acidobacteriota bacterium]